MNSAMKAPASITVTPVFIAEPGRSSGQQPQTRRCWVKRPRTDSRTQQQRGALDYYIEVGWGPLSSPVAAEAGQSGE